MEDQKENVKYKFVPNLQYFYLNGKMAIPKCRLTKWN